VGNDNPNVHIPLSKVLKTVKASFKKFEVRGPVLIQGLSRTALWGRRYQLTYEGGHKGPPVPEWVKPGKGVGWVE